MKTVTATPSLVLPLGRIGENEYTKIQFDVSGWLAELPAATIGLYNQRPQDADAYPVDGISVQDGIVTWTITSAELAQVGKGRCELVAIENSVVAKSAIYNTIIFDALDGSGEAPDPWESWQQTFIKLKAEAVAAAEDAEEAVEHYPRIVNGIWQVWDVQTGAWVSTGVHATGADGVSPTVSVTDISGGHRVTITDAEGPHTFDVMDGQGGTSDYTSLSNKPQINGVTLTGNKSLSDIGAASAVDVAAKYTKPIGGIPASDLASGIVMQTVTVSGTTPTITAENNTQYVCGEVSTLDITLPASGIVDVVFTSGSTPTVLTITPPTGVTVKWANGFDPTSLDANTVYELNIMDGEYGVAGTWT